MTDKTIESLEQQMLAKDKEIENLKHTCGLRDDALDRNIKKMTQQSVIIKDYEQALEFYANQGHYPRHMNGSGSYISSIDNDNGLMARQALDKHKEKDNDGK